METYWVVLLHSYFLFCSYCFLLYLLFLVQIHKSKSLINPRYAYCNHSISGKSLVQCVWLCRDKTHLYNILFYCIRIWIRNMLWKLPFGRLKSILCNRILFLYFLKIILFVLVSSAKLFLFLHPSTHFLWLFWLLLHSKHLNLPKKQLVLLIDFYHLFFLTVLAFPVTFPNDQRLLWQFWKILYDIQLSTSLHKEIKCGEFLVSFYLPKKIFAISQNPNLRNIALHWYLDTIRGVFLEILHHRPCGRRTFHPTHNFFWFPQISCFCKTRKILFLQCKDCPRQGQSNVWI